MKNSGILYLLVICLLSGGCAELMTLIPPAAGRSGGLTTDEITKGLKEALAIGASHSVSSASSVGGFYGNPRIHIPFPPEAIKVKNTLEKAGFSNLVGDFEKSLNSAAEEGSKKALPIFKNAITGMTITDALGILHGPNNAATLYLKSKTESDLIHEFTPVIKTAIQKVEVTRYWNPVAKSYNTLTSFTGGTQINPDLEHYITQKTLDGLFLLIAQEEQEIRQNPAARATEILRKVFAAN